MVAIINGMPRVVPTITDLSQVVAANSTTICAYVGEAEYGPVNTPTFLTNLKSYNQKFGKLSSKHGYMGYSLAVAADSINNHYVVRVVDEETARYGVGCVPLSGKEDKSKGPDMKVSLMETIKEKQDASGLFTYIVDGAEYTDEIKNTAFKVVASDPNNREISVEISDSTINTNKNYKTQYGKLTGEEVKVILPESGMFAEGDSIVVSSAQQTEYDGRCKVSDVANSYTFKFVEIVAAGEGYTQGEVVSMKNTACEITGQPFRVKVTKVSEEGAVENVELLDTLDYNPLTESASATFELVGGTGADAKIMIAQTASENVIKFTRQSGVEYQETLPTDIRILKYPTDKNTTFSMKVYNTADGATTLVEQYNYLTLFENKDQYGNSTFVEDVINGRSEYIQVFVNPYIMDDASENYIEYPIPAFFSSFEKLKIAGGKSGDKPSVDQIAAKWSLFNDRTKLNVTLLMNCGYSYDGNNVYQSAMLSVAEKRRDCFCLFDVPSTSTAADSVLDWRKNDQGFNTYRGAVFTPWVKAYNSAEGKRNFNMPASSYIAKIIGAAGDPWVAPAGPNRGGYISSIVSPTGLSAYYDEDTGGLLYENQLNCGIRDLAGFSNWGQKTLQMKPSALDRINVARTVIFVETTLRDAARNHLFENNTAFERMQITLQFGQFLDTILNGGGISRYQVICDETNNTPYIIQNNQLVIDVYLWPVYTTEYIALNTIVMGADAEITITSNE